MESQGCNYVLLRNLVTDGIKWDCSILCFTGDFLNVKMHKIDMRLAGWNNHVNTTMHIDQKIHVWNITNGPKLPNMEYIK